MDYYAIAPLNHLDLVGQYPRHLVEAGFLEGEVLDFYAKLGKRKETRIIIDNGTGISKEPIRTGEYLSLAHQIHADEIVMPDHWKDAEATMEATDEFYDSLSEGELGKFSLMGVPHGKTVREWFACYEFLIGLADVIGLAYKEWSDRSGLVRLHYAWDLDEITIIPFHFLGLWNARELLYKSSQVRSVDTSMPFRLAQKRMFLDQDSVDLDPHDWEMKLDEYEQTQVTANIAKLEELAKQKPVRPLVD